MEAHRGGVRVHFPHRVDEQRAEKQVGTEAEEHSRGIGDEVLQVGVSSRDKALGPFVDDGVRQNHDRGHKHSWDLFPNLPRKRPGNEKRQPRERDQMQYLVVDPQGGCGGTWDVSPGKERDPIGNQENRSQADSEDRGSNNFFHYLPGCYSASLHGNGTIHFAESELLGR